MNPAAPEPLLSVSAALTRNNRLRLMLRHMRQFLVCVIFILAMTPPAQTHAESQSCPLLVADAGSASYFPQGQLCSREITHLSEAEAHTSAQDCMRRGEAAVKAGDWEAAGAYYAAAEDQLYKIGSPQELAKAWFNLGVVDVKRNWTFRATCWFKLYLIFFPQGPTASVAKEQIRLLEAAYEQQIRDLANRSEPLVLSQLMTNRQRLANGGLRPDYAAALKDAIVYNSWDVASALFFIGDKTEALAFLEKANGPNWINDWRTQWLNPERRIIGDDPELLVRAMAAAGLLDEAANMLAGAYDAPTMEFFSEQGDSRYDTLLDDHNDGPRWWSSPSPNSDRPGFLRDIAQSGITPWGCDLARCDDTNIPAYVLEVGPKIVDPTDPVNELSFFTFTLANDIALPYRKVHGPTSLIN